jgi:hypothetical protein
MENLPVPYFGTKRLINNAELSIAEAAEPYTLSLYDKHGPIYVTVMLLNLSEDKIYYYAVFRKMIGLGVGIYNFFLATEHILTKIIQPIQEHIHFIFSIAILSLLVIVEYQVTHIPFD